MLMQERQHCRKRYYIKAAASGKPDVWTIDVYKRQIQNYIENVDKTFVYANPNKKSISIQEFEKKDFSQLVVEEE